MFEQNILFFLLNGLLYALPVIKVQGQQKQENVKGCRKEIDSRPYY